MDRHRKVLDLLLADVDELDRELVGDLLVDGARHAQSARLGDAAEAARDVDAVAQQVAVALHHVADGDSDPEAHLPARRIGEVAGAQALLHVDRAAHRLDGARKLGQHGVAGGIENPAREARDEILEDGPVGLEAPQRFLFVLGHQLAVTGDVGSHDGCNLAFHERARSSSAD